MAKKAKGKWTIYAEYSMFRTLLFLMAVMPECLLYPLVRGILRLAYYVDSRHRNRAIRHLLHAGIAKDRAEAVRIAKANFAHIANVLCDIGTSERHIKQEKIDDLIHMDGDPELVNYIMTEDEAGRTRQIIIATAHFGNWEVAGNLYVWMCRRKLMSVMRPLDNPLIGEYIYSARQSANHRICSKAGALKQLLLAARQGESICLVVDQHAGPGEGVEVNFFGKLVSAHASLAKIHLRTGIPIIVGACRRLDNKHHYSFDAIARIEHKPTDNPEEDVRIISQQYMDALEKMVRRDPSQWLWSHRRFLDLRRADGAIRRAKLAKKS